ncbi:MAG: hypothetical protein V2J24_11660 [Pseudomonadales bacterium]|jgi:hypothetical protein|nr:hypothetical protein [Pseudomonadales bacterium]
MPLFPGARRARRRNAACRIHTMIASLAHRLGYVGTRKGRGVVLLSGRGDELSFLRAALRERSPRLNLYATSEQPGTLPLRALPRSEPACRRLLVRTRAHALIVDAGVREARPLLAAARRAGVPTVLVAATGDVDARGFDLALYPQTDGEAIAEGHVDRRRDDALPVLLDLLEPALRRAQRQGKQRRLPERLGRWLLQDGPLGVWFQRRFEPLGDLEALRHALGSPQTVLCLGNGPSSEDDAVHEVAFDALFRVNHAWRHRGVLTDADCVFTGLRASVGALPPGTPFVFQTRADAEDLRYRCATLPGPVRYTTAEDLGVYGPHATGEGDVFRPTNGAIMVAVAAALQPARLVISGIDLFSHPAGTYPGDVSTPNAYTIAHDRDDELAFMFSALDRYGGELVILNEVLRDAWAVHRGLYGAARPAADSAAIRVSEGRT